MKKLSTLLTATLFLTACNSGGISNPSSTNTNQTIDSNSISSKNDKTNYYRSIATGVTPGDKLEAQDFVIAGDNASIYTNITQVTPRNSIQHPQIVWHKEVLPGLTEADKSQSFNKVKACGQLGKSPFFIAVGSGGLVYISERQGSTFGWKKISTPRDIDFTDVACSLGEETDASIEVMLSGFIHTDKSTNDKAVIYYGEKESNKQLQLIPLSDASKLPVGYHYDAIVYTGRSNFDPSKANNTEFANRFTAIANDTSLKQSPSQIMKINSYPTTHRIKISTIGNYDPSKYGKLLTINFDHNAINAEYYFLVGTSKGILTLDGGGNEIFWAKNNMQVGPIYSIACAAENIPYIEDIHLEIPFPGYFTDTDGCYFISPKEEILDINFTKIYRNHTGVSNNTYKAEGFKSPVYKNAAITWNSTLGKYYFVTKNGKVGYFSKSTPQNARTISIIITI